MSHVVPWRFRNIDRAWVEVAMLFSLTAERQDSFGGRERTDLTVLKVPSDQTWKTIRKQLLRGIRSGPMAIKESRGSDGKPAEGRERRYSVAAVI